MLKILYVITALLVLTGGSSSKAAPARARGCSIFSTSTFAPIVQPIQHTVRDVLEMNRRDALRVTFPPDDIRFRARLANEQAHAKKRYKWDIENAIHTLIGTNFRSIRIRSKVYIFENSEDPKIFIIEDPSYRYFRLYNVARMNFVNREGKVLSEIEGSTNDARNETHFDYSPFSAEPQRELFSQAINNPTKLERRLTYSDAKAPHDAVEAVLSQELVVTHISNGVLHWRDLNDQAKIVFMVDAQTTYSFEMMIAYAGWAGRTSDIRWIPILERWSGAEKWQKFQPIAKAKLAESAKKSLAMLEQGVPFSVRR